MKCSLVGLLCVVLLLLCSRWWLPMLVPAILGWWDVQVATVQRMDSGRWELRDVSYTSDTVRVVGDVLEVPSGRAALQAYWRGESAQSLQVGLGAWTVTLAEDDARAADHGSIDVVERLHQVREALAAFEAYVPAVQCDSLSILLGVTPLAELRALRLRQWHFEAGVDSAYLGAPIEVLADLGGSEWQLQVISEHLNLQAAAGLSLAQAARVSMEVHVVQGAESLRGQIRWQGGEVVPSEMLLSSKQFTVPRQWMACLGGAQIESLQIADLNMTWADAAYVGQLTLMSELSVERAASLPVQASLGVTGDLRALRIERCEFFGPWGQLELQDALVVDLAQGAVLEGADLVASLDLEQQDWMPATGHLDGLVSIRPESADAWGLRFDLNGKGVSYGPNQADRVRVVGEVQGSAITIEHMQLDLLEETEADRIALTGVADWLERTMDLHYELALGAECLNEWIEAPYFADALRAQGRVFGSFDAPEMEGSVAPVRLNHPYLQPITLSGEVRALSDGGLDVALRARCAGAALQLDLAAQQRGALCSVTLKQAVMTDPERPTMRLLQPVDIRYQLDAPIGARLFVEPVYLESEESTVQMTWGADAGFLLSLRNLSSDRMQRWLRCDLPRFQVDELDLALTQLQPQVLGQFEVHGQVQAAAGQHFGLDLVSQIGQDGLEIESLALMFAEEPLLAGSLTLPLRLQLPHARESFWAWLPRGHCSGELGGNSTVSFTKWVSERVGMTLDSARFKLALPGGEADLLGTLELAVDGLNVGESLPDLEHPQLADIQIQARIADARCQLERVALVLNESVAVGSLDLPTAAVRSAIEAWRAGMFRWQDVLAQSSGHVSCEEWQFEHWRQYFPEVMRRSGALTAELELQPGLDVRGRLELNDFALRPTLAYSMIDQIGAELELEDRKLTVTRASARVGGSPVTVSGWLDVSDWEHPLWEFRGHGKRVPLVRTNDLIVRSDVDLALMRLAVDAVPVLCGELNFTQSTYLVEFDPMAPRVASGPRAQPPYFSITTPAIADWELDVVGKGESFFRVRSPYFRALVSANLALGGTMQQPELVGGLRVETGDILFPSVRMELDSGTAWIEPTRPNEVQLDFSGIAQVSSYVITMEVEQTLSDPSVYLSATPTLPNSEIVRLLATGGLSGGEVGAVGLYLGKGLLGVGAGGVDSSLADRLSVDVGEAGGREGGSTIGVRYRIRDDLYLRGGYDIHNAHNIDLLWSLFKR